MTEVSYTFSSQFSSSTWTVYPSAEEPIANVNFFEWVTGGQVGIVHCNVIGNGGYGDVHEVSPLYTFLIERCMIFQKLR
jgi:hypothetical protein